MRQKVFVSKKANLLLHVFRPVEHVISRRFFIACLRNISDICCFVFIPLVGAEVWGEVRENTIFAQHKFNGCVSREVAPHQSFPAKEKFPSKL